LKRALKIVAGFLLGWVLLEGAASITYFSARIWRDRSTGDRTHTRFDQDLGWTNVPNAFLPDLYGPGLYVRINGQGFRANHDFTIHVPAGKRRVICSGDSFTFGYGVDNDHTWCDQLARFDPALETVNMGQGGYGIDQAFLWYRRDGLKLDHDVQLFAFITQDFQRALSDSFIGNPKPHLILRNGKLEIGNLPLPKRNLLLSWLAGHSGHLQNLASVRLLSAIASHLRASASAVDESTARSIASAIFHELAELHRQRGSRLVLVYLPTREDYDGGASEAWRGFVASAAKSEDVTLIDLFDDFRHLDPKTAEDLFIGPDQIRYFAAAGHFSLRGNEWVAKEIARRLSDTDVRN